MAETLLDEAPGLDLRVADHEVHDAAGHLGDELPLLGLLFVSEWLGVDGIGLVHIHTLWALLLDPLEGLLVLLWVVDSLFDSPEKLGHVNPLSPDAKVVLHELGVNVGTGNAHAHATDVQVGLVPH